MHWLIALNLLAIDQRLVHHQTTFRKSYTWLLTELSTGFKLQLLGTKFGFMPCECKVKVQPKGQPAAQSYIPTSIHEAAPVKLGSGFFFV